MPVPVADYLFTFLDRSLSYDCPSCGAHCCKGAGLALDARRELVHFARLEPRLAMLVRPVDSLHATPVDFTDGCWFLRSDGRCSIEVDGARADKPLTCRLFPFNRVFATGAAQIVDFNARICPLRDAADARSGPSWQELADELDAVGGDPFIFGRAKLPAGARELGFRAHEERLRDAIAAHLDEPDYAAFCAFQDETLIALAKGLPLPEPHSAPIAARAEVLRQWLSRWRRIFGWEGPALAAASRAAARQAALMTSSWRVHLLLREGCGPYGREVQYLPRRMLATSLLLEQALLARRRPPGLRVATQTFHGALEVTALLGLGERKARLRRSPPPPTAEELRAPVAAMAERLRDGKRSLMDAAEEAFAEVPLHLRGAAFAALCHSAAAVEFA